MTRFEINNFYDGTEQEFNILDQKKNTVFDLMMYENRSLRRILSAFYQNIFTLAQQIFESFKGKKTERFMFPQIPASAFSKPINLVEKDIEENAGLLIEELKLLGQVRRG